MVFYRYVLFRPETNKLQVCSQTYTFFLLYVKRKCWKIIQDSGAVR